MRTILILLTISVVIVNAQIELVSIHQNDWQEHYHLEKAPSFFDPSGADILPLGLSKKADLSHTVFGYLPDWEYSDARYNLRYDLLTHIATFDFYVNASGNISNPSYWPWTDVINAAHAQGVKVILTAVNFDNDVIHTLLTNSTAKNNFFKHARAKMLTYKLDGINIDFEGLNSADRGSLLNGFMADLTNYLHTEIPGCEVSFAGPAVNWGGWDLAGLAESCDYIFIMGYAFYGSWSSTSGPGAPLTGGSYNISNTVNTQYAAVTTDNPQKLILGVPYYGTRWKTADANAYANTLEYLGHPRFADAQVEVQQYGREWDTKSQTPWYNYQSGSEWRQVWYDDAASLGLKYDLAESKNFRGVGMWALGYDRTRTELWDELEQRYYFDPIEIIRTNGLSVTPVAGSVSVTISIQLPEESSDFYAYWSTDGNSFSDSLLITGATGQIHGLESNQLYFFRARAESQNYSAITAVTTGAEAQVLIVDGFNLNSDGHNQYNNVLRHALALDAAGYRVASIQVDALSEQVVNITDYEIVNWFCGDQRDSTLISSSQSLLKNYLEKGGKLLISGSNIGYDLYEQGNSNDSLFYRSYFKADYRADAPFNSEHFYFQVKAIDSSLFAGIGSFYFDDGGDGAYPVDAPDAIRATDGATLNLAFNGISTQYGGCGVGYRGTFAESMLEGSLVYLTFPFETISDESVRLSLMDSVLHFFDPQTETPAPEEFLLMQNYPNPFNPSTAISYQLSALSQVELMIYNVLGQKVRTLVNQIQDADSYEVIFDASGLSSGIYFYRLKTANGFSETRKMIVLQ